MAELAESRQLKKELSLFDVYALATGATLSSGFFLLPGLAAMQAGSAVVIAYMLGVVPFLPGIFSKIELATAMPRAGGAYYFLDRSLGPLVGTIGGLGTWGALMLKTSFALIGIGAYLHLLPALKDLPIPPIAVVFALLFGVVNLFGARKTGMIQSVLVIGLLGLLVWFFYEGVPRVDRGHFQGMMDKGWDPIFATAGLVCVSYMGVTKIASVSEEVKNPERNLPLGTFLGLGTALVVYGLGTWVLVGVLEPGEVESPDHLHNNLTPIASAANTMVGRGGMIAMSIAAVLAFLSVANAGILSSSRYPLAMSRDHLLPRWFAKLSGGKVPHNSVIVTVAVVIVLVTVFDPLQVAKLASAFQLLLFAFNCIAVIVMRESKLDSYDPGFRSPFYPWMQIIGVIAPLAFIGLMGWLPVVFTAGLIAIGAMWYFYYGRKRVARGGAIYHLFARLGQRRFEGLDVELRGILKEKGLRAEDPYDEIVAGATLIDDQVGSSFEELVKQASQHLAANLPMTADKLAESFLEGTRVGATPVSKGVALPHLRLPDLEHPMMVLVRTKVGVHVEVALDYLNHSSDQAIHAIVFLISREEDAAQHLRVLAQVARHVDDDIFMKDWLAANNEQTMKRILLRDERFLSLQLREGFPSEQLIGKALHDVNLPEGALIALIYRGAHMVVPRGDTVLEVGDELTMIGVPDAVEQLKQRFVSASELR